MYCRIELSDFGLSTGFHKPHVSAYYQHLLEWEDVSNRQSQANIDNQARNSIMFNANNLTMTRKQDTGTWKANRRKLASLTASTTD